MPLSAGTRLGPYEIVAPIGAGGMGEVYRAHDPRMGREVAIKVSAERFNDRFEREVHAVAALNHPHICHLYDVGPDYLVMELVEGPTLAERVGASAIPLEESLTIAKQIAEALEAAHEKGIIHRDLKPANVKVTPEGKVKVLDFGLAKAFVGDAANDDPSNSPTLSAAATMQGVILGTAAYMSPEQARGKAVDKRTDIWAFGCVLYELLTGRQAFQGESTTEILAAVLKEEPDWQAFPASTPIKIRDLLGRCLQKDKTLRLRDAGDACIEIHEALIAPPTTVAATTAPATRGWRERATQAIAAIFILTTIAFAVDFVLRAPKPPQPLQAVRLSAEIGADASLDTALGTSALLSPDGTRLALVAIGADQKIGR